MNIYVLAAIAVSLGACVYLAWRRRRPCTYADVPWEIDRISPAAIAELKFSAEGGVALCQVRYVGQKSFHTVASGDPARAVYLRHLARCGTTLAQVASHYVSTAPSDESDVANPPPLGSSWPTATQAATRITTRERPVAQK